MCKISVVINTYNAAEDLPSALEALKGFDEILVCDMESTDTTREIAERAGAKVVIFPKGDYNYCEPARQFAIDHASNDWVFVVDADEIATPQLITALHKIAKEADNADGMNVPKGVLVPRLNYVIDTPDITAYPDYQLRFLDRRVSRWPVEIHCKPIVKGKVIALPANDKSMALRHKSQSLNGILERMNRYTSAEVAKRSHEKVSVVKLIIKPFARFFKSYIIKGGWRSGVVGYICARNEANYKFYTLAKIYESRKRKNL